MTRQISEERKIAYYLGNIISVIGFIMFISVFFTAAANFGDFSNFHSDARSSMFRGFGGMVLIIVGAVIRGVGARGLAGSGVVLDPKQAREDLEPYSRMAGGMVNDALDEMDLSLDSEPTKPERVIMIKCRACDKLNEEDSRFCQECGERL